MTHMDFNPDEGLLGMGVDVAGWQCDLDIHWPGSPFHLFEFYVQLGTQDGRFRAGLLLAGFGFYLEVA